MIEILGFVLGDYLQLLWGLFLFQPLCHGLHCIDCYLMRNPWYDARQHLHWELFECSQSQQSRQKQKGIEVQYQESSDHFDSAISISNHSIWMPSVWLQSSSLGSQVLAIPFQVSLWKIKSKNIERKEILTLAKLSPMCSCFVFPGPIETAIAVSFWSVFKCSSASRVTRGNQSLWC